MTTLHIQKGRQPEDAFEAIARFRHKVFVDQLGWEAVRRPDEREIDAYDSDEAIHIALFGEKDGQRCVEAYSRLLPTTRPHLLDDVYPQILRGASVPSSPDVYEWTRSSGMPRQDSSGYVYARSTGLVYLGVVEWCLAAGIEALTVEIHPVLVTPLSELGFDVYPLAAPSRLEDGTAIVPVIAHLTDMTLRTCQETFDHHAPVLPRDVPLPGVGDEATERPLIEIERDERRRL